MFNSVRPQRRQPTRLPGPWDSPGKNTGVGCHFLLQCMKVQSESEVAQSCLLATPWTAAHQAPPSMGFSRQEYWSGVPLPSLISIARECYLSYGEIRICFLLFRAGRGSLLLIIILLSLFGKDFCLFTVIFDYIQSSSLFS